MAKSDLTYLEKEELIRLRKKATYNKKMTKEQKERFEKLNKKYKK